MADWSEELSKDDGTDETREEIIRAILAGRGQKPMSKDALKALVDEAEAMPDDDDDPEDEFEDNSEPDTKAENPSEDDLDEDDDSAPEQEDESKIEFRDRILKRRKQDVLAKLKSAQNALSSGSISQAANGVYQAILNLTDFNGEMHNQSIGDIKPIEVSEIKSQIDNCAQELKQKIQDGENSGFMSLRE